VPRDTASGGFVCLEQVEGSAKENRVRAILPLTIKSKRNPRALVCI